MNTLRDGFWVIALGVISCYAFFLALGAFSIGDVMPVSIAVGVLAALWALHAWWGSRGPNAGKHDERLAHARERRGF